MSAHTRTRPICQISWCDVEVNPDQSYCAGHEYLVKVDVRKTEEFARKSQELLARIKRGETNV